MRHCIGKHYLLQLYGENLFWFVSCISLRCSFIFIFKRVLLFIALYNLNIRWLPQWIKMQMLFDGMLTCPPPPPVLSTHSCLNCTFFLNMYSYMHSVCRQNCFCLNSIKSKPWCHDRAAIWPKAESWMTCVEWTGNRSCFASAIWMQLTCLPNISEDKLQRDQRVLHTHQPNIINSLTKWAHIVESNVVHQMLWKSEIAELDLQVIFSLWKVHKQFVNLLQCLHSVWTARKTGLNYKLVYEQQQFDSD